MLSPDGSCREALSRPRPWMIANGHKPCSPNTGRDCKVSFKGALQAVNGFIPALILTRGEVVAALLDELWLSVAAHRVGKRPDRIEPGAVKRRPKPHKLLRVTRHKARKRLETGQAA